MAFDPRTERNLKNVHPVLVRVVTRAWELTPVPFVIIEGRRTKARQEELFKAGATRTMNSRHLTGHAVDFAALVEGKIRWDWPLYAKIAGAFKDAAAELGVSIVWGGDWKTFKDGPHIELSRKHYP